MDKRELLARLDEERRTLQRDGQVIETLPQITRVGAADGAWQAVLFSSLTEATADAVIAQEVEHHRRMGKSFEWKLFGHDRPAGLLERLILHGFTVGPREAILVYDLSKPAPWMNDENGRDVVRIARMDQIDDFRRVAQSVFEKSAAFSGKQLADALRAGTAEQNRGYIAYAGGEPVSVGRLRLHPQSWFGGMYGGGTLSGHRGRGHYRAVVAARARDAMEAGAKYLLVEALPTSRPILERLGFVRIGDTWPCQSAGKTQ